MCFARQRLQKFLPTALYPLYKLPTIVGKYVSLATATGVILGNSFGGSIPMWLMGATKMITGAPIADKIVIKIANHWINSNNVMNDEATKAQMFEWVEQIWRQKDQRITRAC